MFGKDAHEQPDQNLQLFLDTDGLLCEKREHS